MNLSTYKGLIFFNKKYVLSSLSLRGNIAIYFKFASWKMNKQTKVMDNLLIGFYKLGDYDYEHS